MIWLDGVNSDTHGFILDLVAGLRLARRKLNLSLVRFAFNVIIGTGDGPTVYSNY
jgi:hypothetical protein